MGVVCRSPLWIAVCAAALSLLSGSLSAQQPAAGTRGAPTVVVTGANRGLGLEFARQYAAKGWRVIATSRNPEASFDLNRLADQYQNIAVQQVDVADLASVVALAARLANQPIDVLVNNAGYFGDPADAQLGKIDFSKWDAYYRVNALGPLQVAEALLPNLLAGQQKKIIALTSRAGAFSYNTDPQAPKMPGHYFYGGSKAALNLMYVTLANDTRSQGVTVAVVSPGQVDTRDLGMKGPHIVPIERSIAGLISVIDGLQIADSGGFWNWDGTRIDW